jgi:hypothetical protein
MIKVTAGNAAASMAKRMMGTYALGIEIFLCGTGALACAVFAPRILAQRPACRKPAQEFS